jgi:adenylosuccinate lyase
MGKIEQLQAISPLDGRYADKTQALAPIFSEFGLIKRRLAIETAWLEVLCSGILPDVKAISKSDRSYLQAIAKDFSPNDALEIKTIEHTTNHDVKAVELWLRQKLAAQPVFRSHIELIHFGITSEDINNLASAMQIRDALGMVISPALAGIIIDLGSKAQRYAKVPMLARTHGQPATPTTLGKEMKVFEQRLKSSSDRLMAIAIYAKWNGATGNYNALQFAYPEVDWLKISRQFVESLGFTANLLTTQIEPHDWLAAFCNEVGLGGAIMTDLARDMWTYISLGYFRQSIKAGEVGSSTMPHKVNPIDFENAEANFGLAHALLDFLAAKLPISRLQRDLSDSSAQRALGEAFGHFLVGCQSLTKGLAGVSADTSKIAADLENQWAVLSEAVQTLMRRYQVQGAYEAIKNVSRGQSMSQADYQQLIDSLTLPETEKIRLRDLTPQTYLGLAAELARLSQ